MKILFLYKYDGAYNFDHWFHMDLVSAIQKTGHECLAYGPKMFYEYNNIMVSDYYADMSMEDLHKIYSFDVAICVTQARMFNYYRPAKVTPIQPERKEGCWLPKDFKDWKGPKVVLEEDYHYEDNNDWYKEMNIDLVLQRHYSNVARFNANDNKGINCIWHPFSVDETIFKPSDKERINKFCLLGSSVEHVYPLRAKISKQLSPLGLMDHPERKIDQDYVECLQSYIGHFSCSSVFHITPAKLFEIMASGSVLFTDKNNYGLEQLFPKGSYITYEPDCSDIQGKLANILNNSNLIYEITDRARKCILDKHTHSIRINQMVDIFEQEFISNEKLS